MDTTPPPVRKYVPRNPDGPFPYSKADLTPMDPGQDSTFYTVPRFVTHIDDNAIVHLKKYYEQALPKKGRILDFCSSWVSHYPPEIINAVESGDLHVLGMGMNKSELGQNPVLESWSVQDLNEDPDVRLPGPDRGDVDASTCVVSIDYLTKPVEVLSSIRRVTKRGGRIHLVISNRCFPTKAISRWLKIDESDRLEMVGDYLWWSGWRSIEIHALVESSWTKDPLWAVSAENMANDKDQAL
ncbi:hypothetical protein B0A52_04913 [Exophiala mesophila]|uniref:Methyltransferase type 11 domain-containing protein n=1 Tax=Exophiala mesophila TaxID=212818 RepID=A0A438N6D9_EXOME|nr:hypothetical protein B0A52_04913 [Exophiala mesophila]